MSDVYAYFRTTSFPAYLDVIREAGEGARAFLRALDHPNYYGGHGPGGSVATSARAPVGRAAQSPRLPGDAAAPAGTRGGRPAGPRDPGRDRRRGAADGPRRQHLYHLPDARAARTDRHGDPHPPAPRRADLSPGQ